MRSRGNSIGGASGGGNWRVWVMLCLALSVIGLLGYYAFYEVGDVSDAPPRVISSGVSGGGIGAPPPSRSDPPASTPAPASATEAP